MEVKPAVEELGRRLCVALPDDHPYKTAYQRVVPCALHLDEARRLFGLLTDHARLKVLTTYASELVAMERTNAR